MWTNQTSKTLKESQSCCHKCLTLILIFKGQTLISSKIITLIQNGTWRSSIYTTSPPLIVLIILTPLDQQKQRYNSSWRRTWRSLSKNSDSTSELKISLIKRAVSKTLTWRCLSSVQRSYWRSLWTPIRTPHIHSQCLPPLSSDRGTPRCSQKARASRTLHLRQDLCAAQYWRSLRMTSLTLA